jgi:hypothetical protein
MLMFAVAGVVFTTAALVRALLLTSCGRRFACCERDELPAASGAAAGDKRALPLAALAALEAENSEADGTEQGQGQAAGSARVVPVSPREAPAAAAAGSSVEMAASLPAVAPALADNAEAVSPRSAAGAKGFRGKFVTRAAHALLILGCIVYLKATTLLVQVLVCVVCALPFLT